MLRRSRVRVRVVGRECLFGMHPSMVAQIQVLVDDGRMKFLEVLSGFDLCELQTIWRAHKPPPLRVGGGLQLGWST